VSTNFFGVFLSKLPQNRHPERSASQIYRVTQRLVARSRRACPERGRGNLGNAYLIDAAQAFPATGARTFRIRQGLSPGPRQELPASCDFQQPLSVEAPPSPLSSRAYPDFLLHGSYRATYVVLLKGNHKPSTEATTLNRKSGGAEGSAVLRTSRGNVFRAEASKKTTPVSYCSHHLKVQSFSRSLLASHLTYSFRARPHPLQE
jgi:hypothetical protein